MGSAAPPSSSVAAVPTVFSECKNRGKAVLASNLQVHEAHCVRNLKRCPHCSEVVPRSQMEEHRLEQTRDLPFLLDALGRGDVAQVTSVLSHGEGLPGTWRGEDDQSVLQLAIALGTSSSLVKMLLEACDATLLVRHQDSAGRTALHMAAQAGAVLLVDALM